MQQRSLLHNDREEMMTQNSLDAAAALLVDIAGPEPVHIEMAARGPKKYYDVHRVLSERDARAHLTGCSTRGATLRHPHGLTRALCYDADTPDDWLTLIAAAWLLSEQGYHPLLEASPAQDAHAEGGHLWIIYTAPVKAAWAYQHVLQSAPMLQEIKERWPGPGSHKVRLPGGRYVRPGVCAWCRLYDTRGTLLSEDGTGAARVLLDYQTPARIVPVFPDTEPIGGKTNALAALPDRGVGQDGEEPEPFSTSQGDPARKLLRASGADQRWHEKYGRFFWFQFTPAQLAAWYNERTQVQEVLPPEKNGMGLASWRGERTASVGLRADGWVDFGASARRNDGRQDGGDALELAVRVTQEAKPEVLRRAARQLVQEARQAMECAAWCGEEPPAWVTAMMTEAGWERYHALRAEAGYVEQAQSTPEATQVPQPTRGVVGFYLPPETAQGDTQQLGEGTCQHHKPVPHEAAKGRATAEALAAAMGVELGDPCPRCGCPLRYPLKPYLMCYKCHPPRGLTDDHWRRLCTLFPLRLSLAGR